MDNMITIITPTYNRCSKLKALYKSLLSQTSKSFEWLVIDDGSTDKTQSYIKELQKDEQPFKIKYLYQENSGKHVALNNAINVTDTTLTFIVDSDDCLVPEAIETIIFKYRKIPSYKLNKLCGISFLKINSKGKLLLNKFSNKVEEDTYVNYRVLRHIKGDMAEVWITKVLKKYPFPVFKNEKFLSEDVVWIKMSGPYKMIFFDDPIYIADYLSEGLTKNRRSANWKSPLGCVYKGDLLMGSSFPFKYRIKGSLYYNIYGFRAGKNALEIIKESKNKIVLLTIIPSYIVFRYWKLKY